MPLECQASFIIWFGLEFMVTPQVVLVCAEHLMD
jgi:hypothetical protein